MLHRRATWRRWRAGCLADVNSPDANSESALMLAAKGGHASTVELLSEGAVVNYADTMGTPR